MPSLTCVFSVVSLITAVTSATVHIFPVIGQSNSMGINFDGHTNEDVAYPNILQTSCCVNGIADNNQCKLIQAQDPLHHDCGSWWTESGNVGFGMSFARELRNKMAADDVIVLVPAAIAGTGFVDNVWTAYNGTGFVPALQRLRSTFQLVAQSYPQHTAVLAGFLWHQGESDAGTSSDVYLSRDLIPMINAWRDSNLIPQSNGQVPFVVGNLVPGWVEVCCVNMRNAIQLVDQIVAYSGVAPSFGLLPLGGDVHFTATSQRILGKRYYAAWNLAKTNHPDV